MKTATAPLPPLRSVKVLDQLRERIRYLHYSLPTEQAYVHWVRAFIRFGSVAKIVKLEHAWRRLDGRNDDGFQVAPFPG